MAASERTNRSEPQTHRHLSAARFAALLGVLGVLLSTLVATAPEANAATPEILLGRNRVGEYQAVRGEDFLAWQQNSREHPGHYDVFARPMEGGNEFKVNAAGTNGANGASRGICSSTSNSRTEDRTSSSSTSPPGTAVHRLAASIARHWEYRPATCGT